MAEPLLRPGVMEMAAKGLPDWLGGQQPCRHGRDDSRGDQGPGYLLFPPPGSPTHGDPGGGAALHRPSQLG
jgi:hypothetical protein